MIDLTAVTALLDDAQKTVTLLDGREVHDEPDLQRKRAGSAQRRRTEVAECRRELNRLADNLTTAAALVRHEYWVAVQGVPDVIFEREDEGGRFEVFRRGDVVAVVTTVDGAPIVSCVDCGTLLVDDGRSPLYNAATDNGTPHTCPEQS